MARSRGNDGLVEVGGNAIGDIVSWSLDETAVAIDMSGLNDTADRRDAGSTHWTGTVEMHLNDAAGSSDGQDALVIGAKVALNLYSEGNGSGKIYRSGNAVVTSLGTNVARNEANTLSFGFEGDGACATATVA